MSDVQLTAREQQYADCEIPMLTAGSAAARMIGAFFASLGQAFLPGINRESKLIRTVREIRYTRYKKAVLRKIGSTPKKGDEKLLKKLNKNEFVLAFETYDPDEFAEQLYEEYMKTHGDNNEK